jgi:hypothetical protein
VLCEYAFERFKLGVEFVDEVFVLGLFPIFFVFLVWTWREWNLGVELTDKVFVLGLRSKCKT